jgi:uncharacterized protein (UPF0276 family)
VYVSCFNHGWDAQAYLAAIPAEAVMQYHLAGHFDHGTHCVDTHDAPVVEAVWELYRQALGRIGMRSTLLEWDAKIPEFEVLAAELERAKRVAGGKAVAA